MSKKLSNFSPDDIAFWMADEPSKKIITESYKGLRVNPGNTPIDRLISIVDANYLDFDIQNTKFQKLAQQIFQSSGIAYPQSEQEWASLIEASSQSQELKDILVQELKGVKSTNKNIPTAKGYVMTMQRGTVINCTRIEPSPKDPNILYCGIGPEGRYRVYSRSRYGIGLGKADFKAKYPAGWVDLVQPIRQGRIYRKGSGGIYGLFNKIITVHKKNVLSIKPV